MTYADILLAADGEVIEPSLHDGELRSLAFDVDKVVLEIRVENSEVVSIALTGVDALSLSTNHLQNVIYAAYVLNSEQLLKKPHLASYVKDVMNLDFPSSRQTFFVLEPASGITLVLLLKSGYSISALRK